MNVDGIMTLQNILKSKAGGMPYEKISRRYAQIDAKNKHNYKQLNFQLQQQQQTHQPNQPNSIDIKNNKTPASKQQMTASTNYSQIPSDQQQKLSNHFKYHGEESIDPNTFFDNFNTLFTVNFDSNIHEHTKIYPKRCLQKDFDQEYQASTDLKISNFSIENLNEQKNTQSMSQYNQNYFQNSLINSVVLNNQNPNLMRSISIKSKEQNEEIMKLLLSNQRSFTKSNNDLADSKQLMKRRENSYFCQNQQKIQYGAQQTLKASNSLQNKQKLTKRCGSNSKTKNQQKKGSTDQMAKDKIVSIETILKHLYQQNVKGKIQLRNKQWK